MQLLQRCSPRLRCGGVDYHHLCPLCRASHSVSQIVSDSSLIIMALVNSRSLGNKTFILNDFINFLFVTETWLSVGD